MSILIKDIAILTMQKQEKGELYPVFRGDIIIEGNLIKKIGYADRDVKYDKVINGGHLLAMPGLINTHGHSAMTLFRGYGDDLELMDWLQNRIWPLEEKLVASDIAIGARLAILEMIESGTTAFADMYFFMPEVAKAAEEAGIRASLCQGLIENPLSAIKTKEAVGFAKDFQGAANGRITTMLGPHAPYTCSPKYLEKLMEKADKHGLGLHIHLSETKTEIEDIKKRYGKKPVELLSEIGFFSGRPILAAHGVYITEEEMSLLAGQKVSIAHNPRSNMKLASGMAPVCSLQKAGINVSLGTDSACSNNNLDMFQELRAATFMAKVRELDPQAMSAAQTLEMATVCGAKALGIVDAGILAPGMKADLILIDTDKPHFYPQHDLISHLVYAASGNDVDTVIVDGQVLMEKRQMLTLDKEKVMAEAEKAASDLVGK